MTHRIFIKVILIVLLILCLFNMPYWYFQLVRIFGTLGFAYLAYIDYKSSVKYTPYIFGVAAILLNPVEKISFGREMWNVVDVVLVVILIISIFLKDRLKVSK